MLIDVTPFLIERAIGQSYEEEFKGQRLDQEGRHDEASESFEAADRHFIRFLALTGHQGAASPFPVIQ